MISFFGWCLNFELYSCIYGHLYPSESFSSYIYEFIVMFECSLTDFVLWVLWHIIWWPEWYDHACLWYFNDDKAKTFCRIFADIDNLDVTLYRYDVSKHWDVGEHMGVWYSIQCWIANFDDSWIKRFALVPNYKSAILLKKILWIINDIFWIIVMNWHDIWVHFGYGTLGSMFWWICSSSSSVINSSFVSSYNFSYST